MWNYIPFYTEKKLLYRKHRYWITNISCCFQVKNDRVLQRTAKLYTYRNSINHIKLIYIYIYNIYIYICIYIYLQASCVKSLSMNQAPHECQIQVNYALQNFVDLKSKTGWRLMHTIAFADLLGLNCELQWTWPWRRASSHLLHTPSSLD